MTDDERPGYRKVVLQGRGYPTAEAAVAKLRELLLRDGIEVPEVPEDAIWASRWTPDPVICPWEARAWIPDEKKV